VLEGDAARLSQVFANLLNNAAKYSDQGSPIEIAARADGDATIEVAVRDHGLGLDEMQARSIFEMFVQAPQAIDRSEGGLGIGLTLVRNLVHMHGGTVVALSDGPGQGSAFVVRLPAATSAQADASAAPRDAATLHTAAVRRVLVVDDNTDAATLLAELCSTIGHEVKVAYDGPQALALLDEFSPEVAVLDIGLPVMDGYELAKRIHDKLGSSCRLIALTGYGQEHDRRRSEQAGFEAHLVKPVDPSRVLELIDGK
jgi:CheY-like chemotaxis protein